MKSFKNIIWFLQAQIQQQVNAIAFISLLAFRTGYWVCGLFYQVGSVPWWDMRIALLSTSYFTAFATAYIIAKGQKHNVRPVFACACIAGLYDIADRYLFDINTYTTGDAMIDAYIVLKIYAHYYAGKIQRD